MKPGFEDLKGLVIDRGLCTGCGTCAGVCPLGSIRMGLRDEEPEPMLGGRCDLCGTCSEVCPGADVHLPELERQVFNRTRSESPADLGVYTQSLKGHAVDDAVRRNGASGGAISALLIHALETGVIDCALVAGFDPGRPWRTAAVVASSKEEILAAARSKQAVVPVNAALRDAVDRGFSKIGAVGLPCHVHGLRKLQHSGRPAGLARNIRLVLGLFCAGEFYFEGTRHILTELGGVEDFDQIRRIDYRGGDWPTYFQIDLKDGRRLQLDRHFTSLHMLIGVWKRDRCQVCIDWSNELSDLAGGDYWNPDEPSGRRLGESMLLVRTPIGSELLEQAKRSGVVRTSPLDPDQIICNFGFEIKKHGAMFRLRQRRRFGMPAPDFHYSNSFAPIRRRFHMAPTTGHRAD